MIYTVKIHYGDNKEIATQLNTDNFNITYSDMVKGVWGIAETNRLSFGTTDGSIVLTGLWRQLKNIPANEITSIDFIDENDNILQSFSNSINNIIYNINLNKPGDMIIFDYEKE
jgi:hypothetical protein